MAITASLNIDLNKLDKSKIVNKGNGKYLNLDIQIRDEINQYNQNVAVYHRQSKEERTNKVDKQYIGNGKVVWKNDNDIPVVSYQANEENKTKEVELDF